MKYDKSLEQVWAWKEALHNDMKGLPMKERIAFINREAKKVAVSMGGRLRKPAKKTSLAH